MSIHFTFILFFLFFYHINATTVDVTPSPNIINSSKIMFQATFTNVIISSSNSIKIIIPPQFVLSANTANTTLNCTSFVGISISEKCSKISGMNAISLSEVTYDSNNFSFLFGPINHTKTSNCTDPFLFIINGENGEETVSSQAQLLPHDIDGMFNLNYFFIGQMI